MNANQIFLLAILLICVDLKMFLFLMSWTRLLNLGLYVVSDGLYVIGFSRIFVKKTLRGPLNLYTTFNNNLLAYSTSYGLAQTKNEVS